MTIQEKLTRAEALLRQCLTHLELIQTLETSKALTAEVRECLGIPPAITETLEERTPWVMSDGHGVHIEGPQCKTHTCTRVRRMFMHSERVSAKVPEAGACNGRDEK